MIPGLKIRQTSKELKTATGEAVVLEGALQAHLDLRGYECNQEFLIASLPGMRGVLGMDFLERVELDLSSGRMIIGDCSFFLHKESQACGHLVVLDQSVEIAPYAAIVIWGTVLGVPECSASHYIFQTADITLEPKGLEVESCAGPETPAGTCPLVVTNWYDQSVILPGGEVMGHLENLESYCPSTDSCHNVENFAVPTRSLCMVTPTRDSDDEGDLIQWEEVIVEEDSEQIPSFSEISIGQGLSDSERIQVTDLLNNHKDLFVGADGKLGQTSVVKHKINTGESPPIRLPPRRLPLTKREQIKEELDKMLQAGVIKPSNSEWASPVVLVPKKDGSTRFCVDYRQVNNVTRKDAYPLPRIDDCLDTLAEAKWFCTLDLTSGYWQVAMDENSRCKTAFVTQQGLFEFEVMPFGLCNAPATFERLMESILRGLQWHICLVYIDDIIVFGKSFHETMFNLKLVFERIQEAGLKLKPKKCELFQTEVKFLGHVVSREGVKCDPQKIERVLHWPEPKCRKEVQSFLGFCNYYRRFIDNYSSQVTPLTKLTRMKVPFIWTEECKNAFQELKGYFVSAPILSYPSTAGGKFIVDTDASGEGIGAVLSQIQDGEEKVIAYASATLGTTRRKYCPTYRELFAAVTFIKHFRSYLLGRPFVLRTDHASLTWLLNFKDLESGMLARWLACLSEYDFTIEHRLGRHHGNADGLSRRPESRPCKREECPSCWDTISKLDPVVACVKSLLEPGNQEDLSYSFSFLFGSSDSSNSFVQEQQIHTPVTKAVEHDSPGSLPEGDCAEISAVLLENEPAEGSSEQKTSVNSFSFRGDAGGPSWCWRWATDDLKKQQQEDENLCWLIHQKSSREHKPAWKDVLSLSSEIKTMWAQWDALVLDSGILCKKNSDGSARPILPKNLA